MINYSQASQRFPVIMVMGRMDAFDTHRDRDSRENFSLSRCFINIYPIEETSNQEATGKEESENKTVQTDREKMSYL
tara:strand:- start:1138 stop:1368 length:231 start_codon:yes stop_codon:yes gene_type:complete